VDAICDDESPDFRSTEYTNPNAINVTLNKTTAAAPTNGFVVLFAVPMTYTGNVEDPAVDTELAMMVLSRHSVNDSRPPAINAELINGKVI
jgi:hypothetical protein